MISKIPFDFLYIDKRQILRVFFRHIMKAYVRFYWVGNRILLVKNNDKTKAPYPCIEHVLDLLKKHKRFVLVASDFSLIADDTRIYMESFDEQRVLFQKNMGFVIISNESLKQDAKPTTKARISRFSLAIDAAVMLLVLVLGYQMYGLCSHTPVMPIKKSCLFDVFKNVYPKIKNITYISIEDGRIEIKPSIDIVLDGYTVQKDPARTVLVKKK